MSEFGLAVKLQELPEDAKTCSDIAEFEGEPYLIARFLRDGELPSKVLAEKYNAQIAELIRNGGRWEIKRILTKEEYLELAA